MGAVAGRETSNFGLGRPACVRGRIRIVSPGFQRMGRRRALRKSRVSGGRKSPPPVTSSLSSSSSSCLPGWKGKSGEREEGLWRRCGTRQQNGNVAALRCRPFRQACVCPRRDAAFFPRIPRVPRSIDGEVCRGRGRAGQGRDRIRQRVHWDQPARQGLLPCLLFKKKGKPSHSCVWA